MPNSNTSTRRRTRALLAGALLGALAALCAWGGWAAAQPELDTFLLDGARDIRYEPVGPGTHSLLFNYDGSVTVQTVRLYTRAERRGWQLAGRCAGKTVRAAACWAKAR
jgi:hypothetical protein